MDKASITELILCLDFEMQDSDFTLNLIRKLIWSMEETLTEDELEYYVKNMLKHYGSNIEDVYNECLHDSEKFKHCLSTVINTFSK